MREVTNEAHFTVFHSAPPPPEWFKEKDSVAMAAFETYHF
jgi:hypothetical protein